MERFRDPDFVDHYGCLPGREYSPARQGSRQHNQVTEALRLFNGNIHSIYGGDAGESP
jgi:hypothetical protein